MNCLVSAYWEYCPQVSSAFINDPLMWQRKLIQNFHLIFCDDTTALQNFKEFATYYKIKFRPNFFPVQSVCDSKGANGSNLYKMRPK